MARHERVIIDLGTGDGRAALAAAAAEPRSLVIGIDAVASAMTEASRRASHAANGAAPNPIFVVAAAEAPPPELHGLAGEVRILFPWGSLLRGVLGRDEVVAAGLAALVRPGGRASALVSITDRDGLDGIRAIDDAALDAIRAAHDGLGVGLELVAARPATAAEVRATRSTWGRRLLTGAPGRPVWRLEFSRRN